VCVFFSVFCVTYAFFLFSFCYSVYVILSNGRLIEFWICCHIPLQQCAISDVHDIVVDLGSVFCSREV
jgi:hypothetical protein